MRKDEIKWSLSSILELSKLQKKLILSAIEALKVWGTLVYSTCTMTPEEDEEVLDYALQELWDAIEIVPWELPWLVSHNWQTAWQWTDYNKQVHNAQKIWPHTNDTEGFFVAKIIKKSATQIYETKPYYTAKTDEVVLKWKELKALFSHIQKRFDITTDIFKENLIVRKWNHLEIRTKQSKQFSQYAMIQNIWIPFWELIDNNFYFSFYAAQLFWKYAQNNIVELQNIEEAELFRTWKDLHIKEEQCQNCSSGQVIIRFENIILWASLLQDKLKLKNQVPRETIKI